MSLFQSILKQLEKKVIKNTTNKKALSEILSSVVGITITEDMFQVNNGVLLITASPTIKTAVLLKKEKILATLKEVSISVTKLN